MAWSVTWEPRTKAGSEPLRTSRENREVLLLSDGWWSKRYLIQPEGGKLVSKVGGREREGRSVESRKGINIHARGQVKCGTFQQLQVG